jgi:hypothetical protein
MCGVGAKKAVRKGRRGVPKTPYRPGPSSVPLRLFQPGGWESLLQFPSHSSITACGAPAAGTRSAGWPSVPFDASSAIPSVPFSCFSQCYRPCSAFSPLLLFHSLLPRALEPLWQIESPSVPFANAGLYSPAILQSPSHLSARQQSADLQSPSLADWPQTESDAPFSSLRLVPLARPAPL